MYDNNPPAPSEITYRRKEEDRHNERRRIHALLNR